MRTSIAASRVYHAHAYNKYSFLALPLTTRDSGSGYKIPIGDVAGKQAFAIVSQLRNIDSRRLYQKITWLAPDLLHLIRNEAFRINSGSSARKK